MGVAIDCREFYNNTLNRLKINIENLSDKPRLMIVRIGYDSVAKRYADLKQSDCKKIGVNAVQLQLDTNISQDDAERDIKWFMNEFNPHGVMIELPIPGHLKIEDLLRNISDAQDIDGLKSTSKFKKCTPLGIIELLKSNNISLNGKHVVILGRGKTVGKELAKMLLDTGATVTSCNSKTVKIRELLKLADVVISCAGIPNLVTPDLISDNVILIDAGASSDYNGKICGDISSECYTKSSLYTTVPGGIGLVTRATSLDNLFKAYIIQMK